MKTYTYSEARQQFSTLLDEARLAGRVLIRRRNGQMFVLQPAKLERSPLDVPGVDADLSSGEVTEWVKVEREESASRLLDIVLSEDRERRTSATGTPPTKAGRAKKSAGSSKKPRKKSARRRRAGPTDNGRGAS